MATFLTDTNPEKQRYKSLLDNLGRDSLHALFPQDFEAYFISMELVDSVGVTESFITFPVQPDAISETAPRLTNVKKTAGGVVSVGTQTFVPRDIEIKGNFGRNLRFAIGNEFVQGGLIGFARNGFNLTEYGRPNFSNQVKTGYGVVKSIEGMLNSSELLDSKGKPKKLYLYNTILGNNYIVKVKNFIHSQNVAQNMIPQYTINLTAVAPLDQSPLEQTFNLGKAMSIGVLNKAADTIASNIGKTLGL